MSNLFAALRSSASSLRVFTQALEVTQNNVTNANTPGYAKQRQILSARPFDPDTGLVGGVEVTTVQSCRDVYAELGVRRQLESQGRFDQLATSLAPVELSFDISGDAGIAGALSRMFQSFADWGVNPNDGSIRQRVVDSAQDLAHAFNATATDLSRAAQDTEQQLRSTVDRINDLSAQLAQFNADRRGGDSNSGMEAGLYSTLEELSEIGGISTITQPDGSVTVLLGGEVPLVVGANRYKISFGLETPAVPPPSYSVPQAVVRDSSGNDVTVRVAEGRLAGLLEMRNRILPSLTGDAYQAGDLNRLAMAVGQRVNDILKSGSISTGVAGVDLFTWSANDTRAAQTLAVVDGFTGADLAAIQTAPTYVSNGAALQLANLAHPSDTLDKLDELSFIQFYGQIAARIGNEVVNATENRDLQKDLVAQARSLREQNQGVSLDEEAINVIQYQRAYQAASQMVNVLNQLTEDLVNLIR